MRPLITLSIVSLLFLPATPAGGGATVTHTAAPAPQMVPIWAPERGWQLVQDHPIDPDLVVVGRFGEEYEDPNELLSPAERARRERSFKTANMPRLVLACENGATALTIVRPPEPFEKRTPPLYTPSSPRTGTDAAFALDGEGVIELIFEDGERIQLDLRNTPHRIEPIYLPDPFDTIQELIRHETLYYFEINRGEPVYVPFSDEVRGAYPDAVFHLEGLGEFVDGTRDPCGWGAD